MTKNPWIAAALNFFFYGLGYLYLGKKKVFGTLFLVSRIASFIGETYLVAYPSSFPINGVAAAYDSIETIGFVIISLALAYDAYELAKQYNFENPSVAIPTKKVRYYERLRPAFWGLILFAGGLTITLITLNLSSGFPIGHLPLQSVILVSVGSLMTFLSIPIAVLGELIRWYGKRKARLRNPS